jgi:hypothetical protein
LTTIQLLPGISQAYVIERLRKAGGNEIRSGKFHSEDSSAALAVNCFGWFADRAQLLPPFPTLKAAFPATSVDVEFQARFPWAGGRHPWLDAVAITKTHFIGIESKRFEPFRDAKTGRFSDAFARDKWGSEMMQYQQLRIDLMSGAQPFRFLDATQLVKHAFGLRTQAARLGKLPVLVYLYAEPRFLKRNPIPASSLIEHRDEISRFTGLVKGAEVKFHSVSYPEWIHTWSKRERAVVKHGKALIAAFSP